MSQQHEINWVDVNARINIAGALILIAILLLVISYKLVGN